MPTPRAEGHPQFIPYLQEVLGGIQDWQAQATEHVGLNLRTLSHDQQQLYQPLLQLNAEAQEAGTIAEETAEQYWEELQSLRQHMKNHQEDRDQQIAEALRTEQSTRESQGLHLASHLTETRSLMEAFVTNQLPHLINQRVSEAIQVERIREPRTYSREEVDQLVQRAVQEALEKSTAGLRESTPKGRGPPPLESEDNPLPRNSRRKGKEREGPPQGPPAPPKPPQPPEPPGSPSSHSSSPEPDPPRHD